MNNIKINNCVDCPKSRINNRGKEYEDRHFFIECELNCWDGQRGVRISEQFAEIPNNCPLIEKDYEI